MSDSSYNRLFRPFEPRVPSDRASDRPPGERRGPGSDPLLELARLIGQSDPLGPGQGRDSLRVPDSPRDAPVWETAGQDDYPRPEVKSPPPRFPLPSDFVDKSAAPVSADAAHYPERFAYPAAPDHARDEAGPSLAPADGAYTVPQASRHGAEPAAEDDDYAEAGEYPEHYEYEAEFEDDARDDDGLGLRRRNTTKLVIAVLGLAVFGSAAAFGFRTVFKGGVQTPPPVIRADNSPTRTIPSGAAGEASAKPINERLGAATAERLLPRQEEPVELRDPARGGGAVIPGTGGPFAGGLPASTSVAAVPGSNSVTEPKRVHTVTIRADEGAAAGAAAPPTRAASARAGQSARPASPSAANAGSSGAPLALTPQAMGNADASPVRTATATPPSAASRPADSGGFVVQLAAQKSEAEAQATFRTMQAKYSVLGGQRALIRRKDQGDRGVFYAAQVGPFGTRDEASQLCDSLKSAGGSCFVQKN
jgi:cell division septation protein DedD